MPGYELPVRGRDGQERDFVTHARTPEKERARTASCAVAMLAVHARRGQV
jgi:hypothetical protein